MSTSKMERNYGIDLYKIMAMIMVIILHILGQGGPYKDAPIMSPQYLMTWFLIAAGFCSVNCFAMASGYLMVDTKFKLSRLVEMWFQVLFYSFGITLIFQLFNPEVVNMKLWLSAVFPILFKEYWYFTAYMGMILLTPIINAFFSRVSKKGIIGIISVIILFSVYSTISKDVFELNDGFSVIWLLLMYVMGAAVKKLDIKIDTKKMKLYIVISVLAVVVTFLSMVVLGTVTKHIFGVYKGLKVGYTYVSPLIVLIAALLLIVFANMKIRSTKIKKVAYFFAPITFDSYLIHVHPIIFYIYLDNAFKFLVKLNPVLLAICTLGIALLGFLILSLIGRIRVKIFKLLRIRDVSSFIANKIEGNLNKVLEYFDGKVSDN